MQREGDEGSGHRSRAAARLSPTRDTPHGISDLVGGVEKRKRRRSATIAKKTPQAQAPIETSLSTSYPHAYYSPLNVCLKVSFPDGES